MKYSTLFLAVLIALMIPFALHAAGTSFVPLTQLPAFQDVSQSNNLSSFFNSLYKYCIGIAAALAVLQLIRAGIMYMSPDSIGEKSEAKNLIGLSLFGLLLVLSPVIVFSLIDPRILNLHLDLAPLRSGSTSSAPAASTPVAPNQPANGALSTGGEFPVGSTVSCLYPGGGQGNRIATVVAHVYDQQAFLQVRFENETVLRYVAPGDCHGYQANTADTSGIGQYHVNDMVYCPLDAPRYTHGQVTAIDTTRGWLTVRFGTVTTPFGASSCFKSGSAREQQVCGTAPNCSAGCSVSRAGLCEPSP